MNRRSNILPKKLSIGLESFMLGLAMLSPSSHNQFSSRHGTAVGTVNNYTYNCKYANNNITTAEPRGYHEISRLRKYGKTDHAPRQVYTESNRV